MDEFTAETRRLRRIQTKNGLPVLFHVTRKDWASRILAGGFRDAIGTYGMSIRVKGVWLSNRPLDCNEGAFGNTVLKITFCATLTRLREFECIEKDKPYREWIVPAAFISRFAAVSELKRSVPL